MRKDSPQPQYHPISMLPTVAELIEGGLADAREIYVSVQQARAQPHLLDDETAERAAAYHTEGLEFADIYEEQLRRWASGPMTPAEAREVTRLRALIGPSRQLHKSGLALARELAGGTIERILERSDEELGLAALLGGRRPGGRSW